MILRAAASRAICVAAAVSVASLWGAAARAQTAGSGGSTATPTATATADTLPPLPPLPPPPPPPPIPVTVTPLAPAPEVVPEPAEPPAPEPEEVLRSEPPAPPPRWSLGINGVALLFGRASADVEYAAAQRVALVANLHADASALLADPGHYYGFGGELGLRFYPKEALHGFFMRPSVLGGYYSVDYYGYAYPLPNVGFAWDFGTEVRWGKNGFVVIGGGVQHLWSHPYPADFPAIVGTIIGGGGWPLRFLLSVGWTFR